MATAAAKTQCFLCKKERTFNCTGCTQNFCVDCLKKHVQILGQELDQIENDHDQFRQILNEQKDDPKNHQLIQKINQWEKDSIEKIEQIAKDCRERLIHHTNKYLIQIENRLNNIAGELKRIREENEFNEIDLNHFKEKLNKLKEELNQPSNILLKRQSTSFIDKMLVIIPFHKGNPIRIIFLVFD
jgi:outer membrane murein-binding lipoprotein Lpp